MTEIDKQWAVRPESENFIVYFGYMGDRKCYLNVPLEEAVTRFLEQYGEDFARLCGVEEFTREDAKEIADVIFFDDQFTAYDLGDAD